MKTPDYDLRKCSVSEARPLFEKHHGYASMGSACTYLFGVFEGSRLVAAYAWQPPPPGAARSACPSCPVGVLALSRMVALPREERALNHVSRPLRRQMTHLIDRGRWPVLITYHDEGQGHTGHVYKCSGWYPTMRARRAFYVDGSGARASSYSNGKSGGRNITRAGYTWLQRWEHRACLSGTEARWMSDHGWVREPIPGKVWRSGNQAHRLVKR